ncbi:MSMEG_0569 family flavin-dependent oxidoreductase [Rhodococcus aerolatus]
MQHTGLDGSHHEAVVVGAGQAGLATSWWLAERGVSHVVLERATAGHEWRDRRWDSFCLVTPNRQCTLPGHPYDGDAPDGFMVREDVGRYLDAYVERTRPPLHEGVTVTGLRAGAAGGFTLTFVDGSGSGALTADQVVVATGPYQQPKVPAAAASLPPHVTQLHSSEYRNPAQLPAGATLVVGTGQSGCQIAEDLHLAGRTVHLATGSAPRVARSYRGRDVMTWLSDLGHYSRGIEEFPDGDAIRFRANHYVTGRDGGHDLDLRAFAAEGMVLHGRLGEVTATRVTFADDLTANLDGADAVYNSINTMIDGYIDAQGLDAPPPSVYTPVWEPTEPATELDLAEAGITSVVWATGFTRDFSWVRLPVFDGTGYPTHERGVTSWPGLYWIGLPWQHTWGSGRFGGVAADAEHVTATLADGTLTDRAAALLRPATAAPHHRSSAA